MISIESRRAEPNILTGEMRKYFVKFTIPSPISLDNRHSCLDQVRSHVSEERNTILRMKKRIPRSVSTEEYISSSPETKGLCNWVIQWRFSGWKDLRFEELVKSFEEAVRDLN